MKKILPALALAAWTISAFATPAGRPSIESVLATLQSVQDYDAATISPDGKRVAWVRKIKDARGAWKLAAIEVSDLTAPPRKPRRVTAGAGGRAHDERGPAWSPDSTRIAFLSDAAKEKQMQVWVAPAGGGPPRRTTSVKGQLSDLRWSPDGRSIAFLFVEGSAQETGALTAYKPDAGVVAETIEEQRIAVLDVDTGKVRSISPANLYVYDYDWSPDGKRFAAEAAEGSGTNNYWIAQLYTVDAASGETKSLWKPPLQIACPRWSPDGKEIAVIHGIMSDEGLTGGDIWTVPAAGGQARNRTEGIAASASAIFWRSPDEILFTEYVDGDEGVAALDASGNVRTLWRGPAVVKRFSVAREGSASAAIRSSFSEPPEIVAGPIGAWAPLTRGNAGVRPFWGEARSLTWQSDGQRVQGWLLSPLDRDESKKSPMVVVVHGGPSGSSTASWPSRWTAILPSQGYYVFLPNPRGSFGQGEAFTRGNVKDFGYGDFRDIDRGVDAALAAAPIDPKRLGICGWSYGGYMTMWAVTQTERYAAAVAGAGIVSWQSYYGQNRIDQWLLPFFGASVYDDPEVYARSSPITFIKKAKTPTLVLHGDRDSEVPTPQGYEFWHALKTLGVPTTLVIYENEGHAIEDPKHQLDRDTRLVKWFDEYLKGGAR
ncbi:MAG TPA: S9 family peptidase [Thermoanaerobaculia bacterium]|nr:S9 family peptidase [Thermoanaerobaculia bacterium]